MRGLSKHTQEEIQIVYIIRPVTSLNKRLAKIEMANSNNNQLWSGGGLISNIATLYLKYPVSKENYDM